MPEISRDRRGPRPVLDRRRHPGGRARPGHRAAPAATAGHLVLGDHGPRLGGLRDLPPDHARLRRPAQPGRARRAAGRSCRTTASGRSLSCIVTPGCPFGRPAPARTSPAATSAPASPARPTTAAASCSASSAPAGPPGPRPAPPTPPPAPAARRPLPAAPSAHPGAPGEQRSPHPLRQQRPQPRVRSTKPRGITRNGLNGHVPKPAAPSPLRQIDERRTPRGQKIRRGLSSYGTAQPRRCTSKSTSDHSNTGKIKEIWEPNWEPTTPVFGRHEATVSAHQCRLYPSLSHIRRHSQTLRRCLLSSGSGVRILPGALICGLTWGNSSHRVGGRAALVKQLGVTDVTLVPGISVALPHVGGSSACLVRFRAP